MNGYEQSREIREHQPLVHCITNTVAANFAANAVIAVGGSPVMASEPTEVAQITKLAGALTVNIGTCSPQLVVAIKNAVTEANSRATPWVLDPVGVAATEIRQAICADLIANYHPTVIRGNASEILALAVCTKAFSKPEDGVSTRGLDSTLTSESVMPAAHALAKKSGAIVAVSGERDYVIDGKTRGKVARIANGHAKMAEVTATGCSLTAVLGCFLAVTENKFNAVCGAISYYAVAGQLAAGISKGTGSMHANMLDYLSAITAEEYAATARPPIDLSLYLVTDPKLNLGRSLPDIVRQSLAGGTTIVQLREKDCDSGEFLERARAVKAVCDEFKVPLLINDRVDIALAVDAAGVHIGQDDLPVSVARRLLGPSKIIGLSISTPEEIAGAQQYGSEIDYVGIGPVFPTGTKANAKAALGVAGAARGLDQVDQLACAIGGVNASNAAEVFAIPKMNGIAVVTALTMAENPETAAKALLEKRG